MADITLGRTTIRCDVLARQNKEGVNVICVTCGALGLVDIRLNVAGEELCLRQCPTCQARWWSDDDGRAVVLARVMELAASTKRRRKVA